VQDRRSYKANATSQEETLRMNPNWTAYQPPVETRICIRADGSGAASPKS
jgi:hypothetical protein